MPQELVCVYEVDGGKPAYMHSIDATEAVRLGDYAWAPPSGQEPNDQEKLAAMARMRGMAVNAHPELQSPEEREETRRQANAAAAAATAPHVMVVQQEAPVGEPHLASDERPAAVHRAPAQPVRQHTASEEKK